MSCITLKVIMLLLNQEINTIKSNTAVIANDTSAAIGVRKSGNDLVVTCFLHLRCIDIKHTLIMCFVIFCKNLMQFFTWLIPISCTSLFCHLNTTIRHESSLKRFISLKADNFFKILQLFTDISRAISSKTGNNLCLHIKYAAFCTFFLLKLLQLAP